MKATQNDAENGTTRNGFTACEIGVDECGVAANLEGRNHAFPTMHRVHVRNDEYGPVYDDIAVVGGW